MMRIKKMASDLQILTDDEVKVKVYNIRNIQLQNNTNSEKGESNVTAPQLNIEKTLTILLYCYTLIT